MIKDYLLLTKPGIIFGNLVTALAGFFLASKGSIDLEKLFLMLLGLALVIAAGCVCNNCIDKESDLKMERTKHRVAAQKSIGTLQTLIFASILAITGFCVLYTVNVLALELAFSGLFVYVVLYSFLKHITSYATLVGSISGSIPPVVGYVAAKGVLDITACILFCIVVLWQMPHFYAIALFRFDDYKNASIPVMPVISGEEKTKEAIVYWVIGFALTVPLLWMVGEVGIGYLVTMSLLALYWLYEGIRGLYTKESVVWAKKMFRISLQVIMALSLMISFDRVS